MNYLSVENISKSYGERVLFDNVSFGINKDQKIAFIAKNGSGKTTIMNMINGLDEPDTGQVVIRKEIKMAFLSQNNNLQDELTIEESIFASDNSCCRLASTLRFNRVVTEARTVCRCGKCVESETRFQLLVCFQKSAYWYFRYALFLLHHSL